MHGAWHMLLRRMGIRAENKAKIRHVYNKKRDF